MLSICFTGYFDFRFPTRSCISFGDSDRSFGAEAKQRLATNLSNTINGTFKRLIGRRFSELKLSAQENSQKTACPVALGDDNERFWFSNLNFVERPGDGIGIRVQHRNEPATFAPEQLFAAMLGRLKQIGESNIRTKIQDCVLAVCRILLFFILCLVTVLVTASIIDSTGIEYDTYKNMLYHYMQNFSFRLETFPIST